VACSSGGGVSGAWLPTAGKVTVMVRPPSGLALVVTVASCAIAMACTMDSPRPSPSSRPVRAVPSRWNGWKSCSTTSGGTMGPVLATVRTACPSTVRVVTFTRPWGVVPKRVVHQVDDEAFGERPVARRLSWGDRRLDRHGPVVRFCSPRADDLVGELCQIEWVTDLDARLTAGQGEERLDEPFLLGARGEDPFVSRPQGLRGGVGVGQGDLAEHPLAGQGRA